MRIAIEQIEPFVRFAVNEGADIPLYNTQAELQLLSKLRSQSYRAYISDLAKLPEKDISTNILGTDFSIKREEKALVASSLLPTQREVYLDATLPRLKPTDGPKYFEDTVQIGSPIITFNGRFVIDGHHRWLSIAIINPKAKIAAIDFVSEELTPIQFLKLLQGAIVMEEGGLPDGASTEYDVDVFHKSNKVIREYIEKTLPKDVAQYLQTQYKLETIEKATSYVVQNALSIKYNNLPAVGSPSRELMPQTNNSIDVLDVVAEDAPVVAGI